MSLGRTIGRTAAALAVTAAMSGCKGDPKGSETGTVGKGAPAPGTATSTAAPDGGATKPAPPAIAPGKWTDAGELPDGLDRAQAVVLKDGRVFAYGDGERRHGAIWDPRTDAWTTTAESKVPRAWQGMSVLPGGAVLVTGGSNLPKGHYVQRQVELFDPATGTWTEGESLPSRRRGHSHTALPDGRVLLAGGDPGGFAPPITDLDVYDPATGRFSPHGKLTTGRYFHAATLLPDEGLLLVGGLGSDGPLASAELCPRGERRCRNLPLAGAREAPALAPLPDGRLLLVGGGKGRSGGAVEMVFDPGGARFDTAAPASEPRSGHTATPLRDGRVFVTGGSTTSPTPSAEVYDAASATWHEVAGPSVSRKGHTALLLPDGSVLLVGGAGDDEKPVRTCERWAP